MEERKRRGKEMSMNLQQLSGLLEGRLKLQAWGWGREGNKDVSHFLSRADHRLCLAEKTQC